MMYNMNVEKFYKNTKIPFFWKDIEKGISNGLLEHTVVHAAAKKEPAFLALSGLLDQKAQLFF